MLPTIIQAPCVKCEICSRSLDVKEERFLVLNGYVTTGLTRISFGSIEDNHVSVICFRCMEKHIMNERVYQRTKAEISDVVK
jgi:hypothetical protein